jgi:hypothetical protein
MIGRFELSEQVLTLQESEHQVLAKYWQCTEPCHQFVLYIPAACTEWCDLQGFLTSEVILGSFIHSFMVASCAPVKLFGNT